MFADPRIPSAALVDKTSWRRFGGKKAKFWRNARRRKFLFDDEYKKQRYEELCEFSVLLVRHEELMPSNYVRFHIPREMTKYELHDYLNKLYDVKMAEIELEAVLPEPYQHMNIDDPENEKFQNYSDKFFLHDGNSPNYFSNQRNEGYGWRDHLHTTPTVLRESTGYCIAHCYLPAGEQFQFPELFDAGNYDFYNDLMSMTKVQEKFRARMKIDEKGNGEHLLSRAFADSPLTSGFQSPEHDAQMVDEYQNRSAAIEKAEEDIEYHRKVINQLSPNEEAEIAFRKRQINNLQDWIKIWNEKTEVLSDEYDHVVESFKKFEAVGQDSYRNDNSFRNIYKLVGKSNDKTELVTLTSRDLQAVVSNYYNSKS